MFQPVHIMSAQTNAIIISDSDSDSESDVERSTVERRATPFPRSNLEAEIINLNHQLEESINHHLRFAVMVYTRLRWIMCCYDEFG